MPTATLRRAGEPPVEVAAAGDRPEHWAQMSETLLNCGFAMTSVRLGLDEVLAMLDRRRPAALVLDLSDPTEAGWETVRRLIGRREMIALPILYVFPQSGLPRGSAAGDEGLDGLLTDCSDFVLGPPNGFELGMRLRRLIRSPKPMTTGSVNSVGSVEIDDRSRRASADGREVVLRKKEYDLLQFLMKNPGVVFTREALLRWVWGSGFTGDARTVDVHIRRLRSKLGDDAGRVIETVRRVGYRMSNRSADTEKAVVKAVARAGPADLD